MSNKDRVVPSKINITVQKNNSPGNLTHSLTEFAWKCYLLSIFWIEPCLQTRKAFAQEVVKH